MKFIVDECTGPAVAKWLMDQGHEVFSIFDEAKGLDDDSIIKKAFEEKWILITNDKDFGDMVYRDGRLHCGVILLRLQDERSVVKIQVLSSLFDSYLNRIEDSFLIATEHRVRFARSKNKN